MKDRLMVLCQLLGLIKGLDKELFKPIASTLRSGGAM